MPARKDIEKGGWLEELHVNRHEAINGLWKRYQDGDLHLSLHSPLNSCLQLISSQRLMVRAARDELRGEISAIEVRNLDAPDYLGVNFMGYDEKAHCLAFRGEMRYLDAFQTFADGVIKAEHVEHAFKASSEVRVPDGGLEPDLGYDDFAGRVEVVEYVMWLKEVECEQERQKETWTVISVLRDGVQVALPAEEHHPTEENISELQLEPTPAIQCIPMGDNLQEAEHDTGKVTLEDAPVEPTALVDNYVADDPANTPENELSLVPEPVEEYDTQQEQMNTDAALAAAMEAETRTRYSLRTRTRPGDGANPAAKPVPGMPFSQETPRKKGVAQRKTLKRR